MKVFMPSWKENRDNRSLPLYVLLVRVSVPICTIYFFLKRRASISTPYSREAERKIEEVEARLVSNWNGKGEPWCVFDPRTGKTVRWGLGGIFLFPQRKNVTSWFANISAEDLGVESLVYPHLTYQKLQEIWDKWECLLNMMREHKTGVKFEEITALIEAWDCENQRSQEGVHSQLRYEADFATGSNLADLKGKVVTHYHPDDAPFSKQDLRVFKEANLLEMRAFGKKHLYVLRHSLR